MFSLAAYYESIDPAGVFANIAAVADSVYTVQGDVIYVPEAMANLLGEVGMGNDASLAQMKLESPAIRGMAPYFLEPLVAALVLGSPIEGTLHPLNPIPLDPFEGLECLVNSDPAAPAVHQTLIWFGDGPVSPVTGQIFTIRATAAITLTAGLWVNGALTFSDTLPQGRYQVVGMRARGTNLVAARLNFVGQAHRPGVAAVNTISDYDLPVFRKGRMGVFGEFEPRIQPTLEGFGVTDSAQVVFLDLIKTA